MEWDLFNYEKVIEEVINKPKIEVKKYTDKDYREYIEKHFKADYCNRVFYNIVLSSYFGGHDWLESTVKPQEQLQYFKQIYSSFTYHFQNDEITIFSCKHKYDNAPDDYSVFVAVKDDLIVEFPRVQDLFKEPLCAPACAIWFYNADGVRVEAHNYLNFTDEEKAIWKDFVQNGNEIINPKDTSAFSYSEWWRDRREYYFFYKLKIHKFGKAGRVFDKHNADWFSDYEFTLLDMYNYYYNKEEEQCH